MLQYEVPDFVAFVGKVKFIIVNTSRMCLFIGVCSRCTPLTEGSLQCRKVKLINDYINLRNQFLVF